MKCPRILGYHHVGQRNNIPENGGVMTKKASSLFGQILSESFPLFSLPGSAAWPDEPYDTPPLIPRPERLWLNMG